MQDTLTLNKLDGCSFFFFFPPLKKRKKKKIVVFQGLRDLTSSELHAGVKSQKVNLFKLGFNSTGDLNPSREGYYQIDIINFEITNYSKI